MHFSIGGGVEGLSDLLFKINEINGDTVDTIITVSMDEEDAPEDVRKYSAK